MWAFYTARVRLADGRSVGWVGVLKREMLIAASGADDPHTTGRAAKLVERKLERAVRPKVERAIGHGL